MTEYKQLESIKKTYAILEFLRDQVDLVSGAEVSQALNIPHATVMSHLVTWEDLGVVKRQGNLYGIGQALGSFWAEIKHRLLVQRNEIDKKLEEIEPPQRGK